MYKNLVKKNPGTLPRRKEDDPFFAIWRHYHDKEVEIILSDKQRERLDIYERAFEIVNLGFARGEAAKQLVTEFEEKGFDFSVRTAYQYIQDALDLWGNGPEINWTLERAIQLETVKRLHRKCEEKGEFKAAAMYFAQWVKLTPTLNEDFDLMEKLKALRPNDITITSSPEELRKMANELVQDIDHEDVSND
jgi:hypothetical protein